jgi:hypothetical protein
MMQISKIFSYCNPTSIGRSAVIASTLCAVGGTIFGRDCACNKLSLDASLIATGVLGFLAHPLIGIGSSAMAVISLWSCHTSRHKSDLVAFSQGAITFVGSVVSLFISNGRLALETHRLVSHYVGSAAGAVVGTALFVGAGVACLNAVVSVLEQGGHNVDQRAHSLLSALY